MRRTMKIMSVDRYTSQIIAHDNAGEIAVINMDGGVVILAEDGRPLYEFRLLEDGVSMEVRASHHVKVDGRLLETTMTVRPHSSNVMIISRPEYK